MRICHVITRLIIGGAQENTLLSCEGLASRGHEVTLVSGVETGPEGSLWDDAEKSAVTLVRLHSLVRNPKPRSDLRCVRELTTLFREKQFDVVHTHSSKAGILARLAARRAKIPVVVHTIHGMSFNRTQSPAARWFYRAMERRAARWTHAFVCVADAMTDQAVAAGLAPRERFTTVYSGMRTEAYAPDAKRRTAIRDEWGVPRDAVVVGTVARLFRNKGYEDLINAMLPAVANAPSIRFVWVGDGPHRDRYVEQVRKLGLADNLHLTGLVSPHEVPALIAGFDILAHASRWEGLPRALVQGLLMEVPGIAYDIDGAPEVIEDGATGRIVPLGDTASLAGAIVALARSAESRRAMGEEGRRRCLTQFAAEKMVDDLECLYKQLLTRV